jgi:hypothetical protein
LSIFLLKGRGFRVETLVMTLLVFLYAWTLIAFVLAVPVGRLCAVRSSR